MGKLNDSCLAGGHKQNIDRRCPDLGVNFSLLLNNCLALSDFYFRQGTSIPRGAQLEYQTHILESENFSVFMQKAISTQ